MAFADETKTAKDSKKPAPTFSVEPLWSSGDRGFHTYRIPSVIVTKKGAILAFCEARKNSRSDTGDIDLVMRRSTDNGKTWSKTETIWSDDANTCGNPCPVVDQATETIWLLMTHNLGEDTEKQIKEGKSKSTRTVWKTYSTNDGATWQQSTEITEYAKQNGWTWYATGPGVGIQKQLEPHKGRIIIPCDHNHENGDGHSHVIYLDDSSNNWKLGGEVSANTTNECQVAELADGSLLLAMRNRIGGKHQKAFSISRDGGKTWPTAKTEPAIPEPVCQSSIVNWPAADGSNRNWLLYSGPGDSEKRIRLTIRLSKDGGKTWPTARILEENEAAYSCLTILNDGRIGCLYEKGDYKSIEFAIFEPDWLTGGK